VTVGRMVPGPNAQGHPAISSDIFTELLPERAGRMSVGALRTRAKSLRPEPVWNNLLSTLT
jgi:hypothetical protein